MAEAGVREPGSQYSFGLSGSIDASPWGGPAGRSRGAEEGLRVLWG